MRRGCKISVQKQDSYAAMVIEGDLTSTAEKDMEEAYDKICGFKTDKILIKFDGKSRINSAGIALVINMVMEADKKNCKIFITGVTKHFKKIFELVGLAKYTKIIESEEEITSL